MAWPSRLNSTEKKKKDSARFIFHFLRGSSFPTCIFFFFCFPEEIEKKLNIYRKGCKIWKMLIFCQVMKVKSGSGLSQIPLFL